MCATDGLSFGACDCGDSGFDAGFDAGFDGGTDAGFDAGTEDASDGSAEDGSADGGACVEPTGGFGTSEGSNALPFTLNRCDGTPYSLYAPADGYCDASFTVVVISAGWCGPCRRDAGLLQAELVAPYASRGVRVINVLLQDNDFTAPDGAFCDAWVSMYGLTNPVLLDPMQETQVYFPSGALAAALIIDDTGVIRFREFGVSTGLSSLRTELDVVLAAP